eukprot:COSAG06_NODE_6334_length_2979_cov_6.013194_4_plen_605_part_00
MASLPANKGSKGPPTLLGRLRAALATQEAQQGARGRKRRRHRLRPRLNTRGVSPAFLDDLLGADGASVVGRLTPGQLVHGQNTKAGDPDAWRHWAEGADPLCVRSLTLEGGLSLVETFINTAEAVGDERLTQSSDGSPYFGDATDFVSYTWHGTTCGELWDSLKTRAMCDDGPTGVDGLLHWIDIFAVAQNQGCHNQEDLDFPQVIKFVRRAVAVVSPWSHPAMLTRCWCLFELHNVFVMKKELVVAVPPAEADKFKPRAIAANFDSILSTIVASVDIKCAKASREEDRARILGDIESGCGFEELTVQVVVLMNIWLRSKCSPEYRAIMKPPQAHVRERLEIFNSQKQQAREQYGDDTVNCSESGVVSIGGPGGTMIGGTDAKLYDEPDPFLNEKRISFAGELQANYIASAAASGAIVVDLKGSPNFHGIDIVVVKQSAQEFGQTVAQAMAQGVELWTEDEFNNAMAGDAPSRSKKAKFTGGAAATKDFFAKMKDLGDQGAVVAGGTSSAYDVSVILKPLWEMSTHIKFKRLQLLQSHSGGFTLVTRYGRVGESGSTNAKEFADEAAGIKAFEKRFHADTGSKWGKPWLGAHPARYVPVEHGWD